MTAQTVPQLQALIEAKGRELSETGQTVRTCRRIIDETEAQEAIAAKEYTVKAAELKELHRQMAKMKRGAAK